MKGSPITWTIWLIRNANDWRGANLACLAPSSTNIRPDAAAIGSFRGYRGTAERLENMQIDSWAPFPSLRRPGAILLQKPNQGLLHCVPWA
jgi:hypothetical protein